MNYTKLLAILFPYDKGARHIDGRLCTFINIVS